MHAASLPKLLPVSRITLPPVSGPAVGCTAATNGCATNQKLVAVSPASLESVSTTTPAAWAGEMQVTLEQNGSQERCPPNTGPAGACAEQLADACAGTVTAPNVHRQSNPACTSSIQSRTVSPPETKPRSGSAAPSAAGALRYS